MEKNQNKGKNIAIIVVLIVAAFILGILLGKPNNNNSSNFSSSNSKKTKTTTQPTTTTTTKKIDITKYTYDYDMGYEYSAKCKINTKEIDDINTIINNCIFYDKDGNNVTEKMTYNKLKDIINAKILRKTYCSEAFDCKPSGTDRYECLYCISDDGINCDNSAPVVCFENDLR